MVRGAAPSAAREAAPPRSGPGRRPPEPSRSPAATTSDNTAIYVVESGDTLIRIARKILGDGERWREVFELNQDKLKSADHVEVGMKLKVPRK